MKIPRAVLDLLLRALPAAYTGQVVLRMNFHRGSVGRATIAVEETIRELD